MSIQRLIRSILRLPWGHQIQHSFQVSPEWKDLQKRLQESKRIIDLGCGANPHPRAIVGVDRFMEPVQRSLGYGPEIKGEDFRKRGCLFVQADLACVTLCR